MADVKSCLFLRLNVLCLGCFYARFNVVDALVGSAAFGQVLAPSCFFSRTSWSAYLDSGLGTCWLFMAPLFAFRYDAEVWLHTCCVLIAFYLIWRALYLVSDCWEANVDRLHSSKRYRLSAAGLISGPATPHNSCFVLNLNTELCKSLPKQTPEA